MIPRLHTEVTHVLKTPITSLFPYLVFSFFFILAVPARAVFFNIDTRSHL